MLSPVFSPGPTTIGFLPVICLRAVFITVVSGGTTDEMIEPSISLALYPYRCRIWWISTAYCSSVRRTSVATLAVKEMLSFSKPPMTNVGIANINR